MGHARKDGTLAMRSATHNEAGQAALGDQLPAVLDSDESPAAAAVAAELFGDLAQHSAQWQERLDSFLAIHRPLLSISQLPSAGLAAVFVLAISLGLQPHPHQHLFIGR